MLYIIIFPIISTYAHLPIVLFYFSVHTRSWNHDLATSDLLQTRDFMTLSLHARSVGTSLILYKWMVSVPRRRKGYDGELGEGEGGRRGEILPLDR